MAGWHGSAYEVEGKTMILSLSIILALTVAVLMIRNLYFYYQNLAEKWRLQRKNQEDYENSIGKYSVEIAAANEAYCRENNITGWNTFKEYSQQEWQSIKTFLMTGRNK